MPLPGAHEDPPPPPANRLALKVDVDTFRGTLRGVSRLVEVLRRHEANATFLFSLGPDHSGRTIAHASLSGTARLTGNASWFRRYGVKALLHGTILPGPDIGTRCVDVMHSVASLGFEVGIHAWDHASWQTRIKTADAHWTLEQMQRAVERFEGIFGTPARLHGAADWQMNAHAFRLTQRLGFDFGTDTRGHCPFLPVLDAELVACPQVPTTLPTCDELLALDGIGPDDVVDQLVAAARAESPAGHVFSLHAELEGMSLLPVFERLIERWSSEGKKFLSLGQYLAAAGSSELPRHRIEWTIPPGHVGSLAMQGQEFLV